MMPTAKEKARDLALLRKALAAVTEPKRIVGLDLSITRPGFAVVYADGQFHTDHLNVPGPDATVHGAGHGRRLAIVAQRAIAYVQGGSMGPADLVCLEAPFTGKGNQDGMKLNGLFHGLLSAYGFDRVPVMEIAPTSLKCFACGTSKGIDKPEMVLAARDRLGWGGTVNDEADALFLAHMGWALLGRPLVQLPKAHMLTVERMLGTAPKTTRKAVAA